MRPPLSYTGPVAARGLEYRAVLRDGRYAVLAPISETDAQLVKCTYYSERAAAWFAHPPALAVRLSPELVPDMRLIDGSELLQRVLRSTEVVEHGWWDVAYTTSDRP